MKEPGIDIIIAAFVWLGFIALSTGAVSLLVWYCQGIPGGGRLFGIEQQYYDH